MHGQHAGQGAAQPCRQDVRPGPESAEGARHPRDLRAGAHCVDQQPCGVHCGVVVPGKSALPRRNGRHTGRERAHGCAECQLLRAPRLSGGAQRL